MKIKYLSPTSLKTYYSNNRKFFVTYELVGGEVMREPQTRPMAAGGAFDAYIKAFISTNFNLPFQGFEQVFEGQIEKHQRDWGRLVGKYLFDEYNRLGCLADLLLDLSPDKIIGVPRLELSVTGMVGPTGDIPLLGKPDLFYRTAENEYVILDWKVNGVCSSASPMRGYVRLRGKRYSYSGKINNNIYLEDVNEDWAAQLTIYSWLCGSSVGESFICAIDQICCKTFDKGLINNPDLKVVEKVLGLTQVEVAQHRLRVSTGFQTRLMDAIKNCWQKLSQGWWFHDLSFDESKKLEEYLRERWYKAQSNENEMFYFRNILLS